MDPTARTVTLEGGEILAYDVLILATGGEPQRPPGFDVDASAGLGLSIVRTLLESELGSTLCVRPRPGG